MEEERKREGEKGERGGKRVMEERRGIERGSDKRERRRGREGREEVERKG